MPADADVVINSTSIGVYAPDARLPLDLDSLKPGMVVADVVFSPIRTPLLDDAAALGCRAVDGLGMLVNQDFIGARYRTGITRMRLSYSGRSKPPRACERRRASDRFLYPGLFENAPRVFIEAFDQSCQGSPFASGCC